MSVLLNINSTGTLVPLASSVPSFVPLLYMPTGVGKPVLSSVSYPMALFGGSALVVRAGLSACILPSIAIETVIPGRLFSLFVLSIMSLSVQLANSNAHIARYE